MKGPPSIKAGGTSIATELRSSTTCHMNDWPGEGSSRRSYAGISRINYCLSWIILHCSMRLPSEGTRINIKRVSAGLHQESLVINRHLHAILEEIMGPAQILPRQPPSPLIIASPSLFLVLKEPAIRYINLRDAPPHP